MPVSRAPFQNRNCCLLDKLRASWEVGQGFKDQRYLYLLGSFELACCLTFMLLEGVLHTTTMAVELGFGPTFNHNCDFFFVYKTALEVDLNDHPSFWYNPWWNETQTICGF